LPLGLGPKSKKATKTQGLSVPKPSWLPFNPVGASDPGFIPGIFPHLNTKEKFCQQWFNGEPPASHFLRCFGDCGRLPENLLRFLFIAEVGFSGSSATLEG
jgi:hypothetical protein